MGIPQPPKFSSINSEKFASGVSRTIGVSRTVGVSRTINIAPFASDKYPADFYSNIKIETNY